MARTPLAGWSRIFVAGAAAAALPWALLGFFVGSRATAIAWVGATFVLGAAWVAAGVLVLRGLRTSPAAVDGGRTGAGDARRLVGVLGIALGLAAIAFAFAVLPITSAATWHV